MFYQGLHAVFRGSRVGEGSCGEQRPELLFDGTKIAIGYDGAYWHRPEAKVLVDTSKTLDLLAAGYLAIRMREDDLPSLDIEDPRYVELRVYSTAPQPEKMMAEAAQWHHGVATSGAKG